MYKEYISTAYLLRFLPLGLFNDYVIGLRILHLTYFVGACLALYFSLRSFSRYMAAMTGLLLACCPLIYPRVRLGFVNSFHLMFLVGACFLICRSVNLPERRLPVLGASFLLFLAANQAFYFSWVIAGLGLASFLLFPDHWWKFARDWKAVGLVVLGASLGLIHFVIYNLDAGFPTLRLLFLKIFFPAEYNKSPVDLTPALPLSEEVPIKLEKLFMLLAGSGIIHVAFLLAILILSLLALVHTLKTGTFRKKRLYFLPLLAFLLIFGLILISPKTYREGHYVYLSPFWELAVLSASGPLALLLFRPRIARGIVTLLPLSLLMTNLWTTEQKVIRINATGGTGLFSPAVFDYVDYLNTRQIDSRDVVFLTWGLHMQPYFINQGRFHFNTLVTQLYAVSDPAAQDLLLSSFLLTSQTLATRRSESLYFPLYAARRTDLNDSLLRVAERHGGKSTVERTFYERAGDPVIRLFRLDDFPTLRSTLLEEAMDTVLSDELRITNFGPTEATLPASEALPMWFMATNLAPTVKVCFDGEPLRTRSTHTEPRWSEAVTALVPIHRIDTGGAYRLSLCDSVRGIHSRPVLFSLFDIPALVISDELRIDDYAPREVRFPAAQGRPAWFATGSVTSTVRVCFEGRALRSSVRDGDSQTKPTLTANLPIHELSEPKEYEIYLCDAQRSIRSPGVPLRLVPE